MFYYLHISFFVSPDDDLSSNQTPPRKINDKIQNKFKIFYIINSTFKLVKDRETNIRNHVIDVLKRET